MTASVQVPASDLDVEMGVNALAQLELSLHRLGAEHPGTEVEAAARAMGAKVRTLQAELQALLGDVHAVRPTAGVGV